MPGEPHASTGPHPSLARVRAGRDRSGRATVARVNGSVVRTSNESTRPWRMRQWPGDATVAHLIFVDHHLVPSADAVADAVEHARRRGARSIRTSALFPAAADVVLAGGFDTIDRLELLRLDLASPERRAGLTAAACSRRHRVRALQPWMYRRAADVDRAAFGPLWGNDATSLRDVRRATPMHHARVVRADRRIVGVAISGAAANSGYLQRVAVAPGHRRLGIARDLVVDGLAWMAARGRADCLVNTGERNDAALALYEDLGFERLDQQLVIAERRLTG